MPAPYSDNLYSALDDSDNEQEDALSPADGYFHASSSLDAASSSQQEFPSQSGYHHHSSVPSVPNVLVEDPTQRDNDANAKAREAEGERRLNDQQERSSSPSAAYQPSASRPPLPTHHHRRSVEDDSHLFSGPSRSTPTLPYSSHHTSPIETRPSFHPTPSDAPPAYSPRSPTSPTSPTSGGIGYQTFGPTSQPDNMGIAEEQQGLLPREPESMGGRPGGYHLSWWQRRKLDWCNGTWRRRVKTLIGVLVLLSIVLSIVGSSKSGSKHGSNKDNDSDDNDKGPSKKPSPGRDDFKWKPLPTCYNDPHSFANVNSRFDFHPDNNFTIVQNFMSEEPGDGQRPHIYGDVVLRPLDSDKAEGSVEMQIMTNHKDIRVHLEWREDIQSFLVSTPRKVLWDRMDSSPCIQVRLTAWIPNEKVQTVNQLSVDTVHLNINILEGFRLNIQDKSYLTSVGGNINTPDAGTENKEPYGIESREIWVETMSGDVKGWYPLYDLLHVRTASGDIFTDVGPQVADKDKPKAAVLDVESISGDIRVIEPLDKALKSKIGDKIPARDYVVKLATASGGIQGDLAISSYTKVDTPSGNIKMRLLPVLDPKMVKEGVLKPELLTDSKSGDTKIELLEPYWTTIKGFKVPNSRGTPDRSRTPEDGNDYVPIGDKDPYLIIHPHGDGVTGPPAPASAPAPPSPPFNDAETPSLSNLISTHQSISGNIKLHYPSAWTGHLSGKTLSGDQHFRGKGLQTYKQSRDFVHAIEGSKGDGHSVLKVDSVSGDEDFLVGEE